MGNGVSGAHARPSLSSAETCPFRSYFLQHPHLMGVLSAAAAFLKIVTDPQSPEIPSLLSVNQL